MKKITKNTIKAFLLFLIVGVSSCDSFLDINKDPNNPLDSKLSQVLPTVETVIFEALGNGSGGLSDITSQFVHHTVQRNSTNFYFVGGGEFSIANSWNNLYAGALMDIEQMINKANERESWHYLGVAQTLKAYTYSMLVDVWGNAAFTEFGQGTANPFPKYDNGADIYPALFTLLGEATTNLAQDAQESPGADDLVYGGDIDLWIKLANSLKLKLYNNVRLTQMYDAAAVAAIIDSENIDAVDGGFKLKYTTSNNPENRHPLFKQDYVDANSNYINPYFWLIMKGDFESYDVPVLNPILVGIEDPRIPHYFYNQTNPDETPQNATTSAYFDGSFLAIWFASLNIDPNEGFDQAQSQTVVGEYPAGGAFDDGEGVTAGVGSGQNPGLGGAGFVRLYPYFAHLYTRAELALTMGAPGDPEVLFREALEASLAEVNELATVKIPAVDPDPEPGDPVDNNTNNDIEDYVEAVMEKYDAANAAGKLELILTEKWIASFGFSVDSYTDFRKTGYPKMFDPATDNNPFTIINRVYPVSFPYFTDDLQINPNADPQRDPGSDKVFWDVN